MKSYAIWLNMVVLALGAGCGGEEPATVQLAAAPEPIRIGTPPVVDDVTSSLAHLELTVKEIHVHVATRDDATDQEAERDDGVWVPIRGERQVDLHFGTDEIALGTVQVPPGRITQIRLVLDGDAVFSNGAERTVVACPSCSTSGLKLVLDHDLLVPAGGTVSIKLMFDLQMSALQHADGLKLGPVVHVTGSVEP
jgi:hypothetical protein